VDRVVAADRYCGRRSPLEDGDFALKLETLTMDIKSASFIALVSLDNDRKSFPVCLAERRFRL
jgi:hypothetical protein